jgi:hypothetical protein
VELYPENITNSRLAKVPGSPSMPCCGKSSRFTLPSIGKVVEALEVLGARKPSFRIRTSGGQTSSQGRYRGSRRWFIPAEEAAIAGMSIYEGTSVHAVRR